MKSLDFSKFTRVCKVWYDEHCHVSFRLFISLLFTVYCIKEIIIVTWRVVSNLNTYFFRLLIKTVNTYV